MADNAAWILIGPIIALVGLVFILYRDEVPQWLSETSAQGPIDMSRYSPRVKKLQGTATALIGGILIAVGLMGVNAAIGKILFGAGEKIVFAVLIAAIVVCFVTGFVVIWMGVYER